MTAAMERNAEIVQSTSCGSQISFGRNFSADTDMDEARDLRRLVRRKTTCSDQVDQHAATAPSIVGLHWSESSHLPPPIEKEFGLTPQENVDEGEVRFCCPQPVRGTQAKAAHAQVGGRRPRVVNECGAKAITIVTHPI